MRHCLFTGLFAGTVAAAVGAALWAYIVVATEHQIGWLIVGIGALVGYIVRVYGQGDGLLFGASGALLAVLGCVLANLMAILGLYAHDHSVQIIEALRIINYSIVTEFLKTFFEPVDAFFYGIAIYLGYQLSMITPSFDHD